MARPYPFAPAGLAHSVQTEPPAPGILVVDLDALARNYRLMRETAFPAECAAVVKANAYGLGLAPVVSRLALEGCRRFFVATTAEGREARRLLDDASIYVLDGATAGSEAELRAYRLTPVLNSLEQIDRWRAAGGRATALHIDTGMSRLGLSENEVAVLAEHPERLGGLDVEYVLTHLACADEPEHPLNREQLRRFDAQRRKLPGARTSIGASAGTFLDYEHRGDLVRAGIGLYGGNPFASRANPVEPVVTLRARIVQLREITEATSVGYGATYVARPGCRLAVCGIGYADGYPRALGNRASASFKGRRVPVVGRVSMDLTCIDVSDVPREEIAVGDYVELIGGAVSLEEVAGYAGTIGYEILTGLGARLARHYEGEF